MLQNRKLTLLLRLTAFLIVFACAFFAVFPDWFGGEPRVAIWVSLAVALGVAVGLIALAAVLQRPLNFPPELSAALSRVQLHMMEVHKKVNELEFTAARAARQPIDSRNYDAQFEKLSAAILELRELAFLSDTDRREQLAQHRNQRRENLIRELFTLVGNHDWSRAGRLMLTLETDFPNDDEIAKGRSHLEHSRRLFESETLTREFAEINRLLAESQWDPALDRAEALAAGFPLNQQARELLLKIQVDYAAHHHANAQQIFEEIRMQIDRRNWRRASLDARTFLEKFPQHKLAEKIREQLGTIQDNAEIEERQEIEVRIQELIRAGQFADAIDLAEDVIKRFPASPQADSLQSLLPRIRELSAQHGLAEATE